MTVHFASAAIAAQRPVQACSGRPGLHPLRLTAGAALLACSLITVPAWALTLGPLTVQSSLGEPLRAQIELPGLTPEEFDSLQVQLGSPADFAAAQLPWQALASDVRFQVRRLDNGRSVLQLSTRQTVREPFLDLVVQAQSANGRLLRGYTLLFDPPNLKPLAAATPVAPRVQASPGAAPARPAAAPLPPLAVAAAPTPASVAVRRGQTAGEIAQAHRPAGVTLEQMLVALLQTNPQAFQDSNMNRLRSGSVLQLPNAQQAQDVSPEAARQVVAAQSRDFDAYRQRLAAASPTAAPDSTGRASSGQVQADITESRAEASAADRLTLARGSVDAELSAEAQRREQAEQQARQAEVERNLAQLEQLQASAQAPAAPAAAPAPSVAADAPAAPAPAVNAAPAPPPAESSAAAWLQAWLAHPLALPAAGGLAVLLLVFGLLRRRRHSTAAAPAAALPPALEPQVTEPAPPPPTPPMPAQAEAQPSTLIFSASQLQQDRHADALAEADVFTTYGRHAQAEEILREALQEAPEHLDLLGKLLQVQQARQDAEGFAATATTIWTLTGGEGEAWQAALALGRAFLPQHPLFIDPEQAARTPPTPAPAPATADLPPPVTPSPVSPPPLASEPAAIAAPVALATAPVAEAPPPSPPSPPPAEPAALDFDLDLDFAPATPSAPADAPNPPDTDDTRPAPAPATVPSPDMGNGIDFDLDLDASPAAPADPAAGAPAGADLLPPSLHDLSLDLDVQEDDDNADPLETKLSLAREFAALGDTQGARILAEAVASAADGDLQARARAFLAELG